MTDVIRMLRRPAVEAAVGIRRSTLYSLVAEGLLPPPVRVGVRASAWPADEVTVVMNARIAGWSPDEIRALVRDLIAARSESAARRIPGGGKHGVRQLGANEPVSPS